MAFATDESREPKPTKRYRENNQHSSTRPPFRPDMQNSTLHKPSALPSAPVMIPNDLNNVDHWNKPNGFCFIPQHQNLALETIPLFSSAFNFLSDLHTQNVALSPPQTPLPNNYINTGLPSTPTEYSSAGDYPSYDPDTLMPASPPESYASANSPRPATEIMLNEALSSFNISYGESGISMETNVSSASGLRSLIDTFNQVGISPKSPSVKSHMSFSSTGSVASNKSNILSKNRHFSAQPVNFFEKLGRVLYKNHQLEQTTVLKQQIMAGCIDTYFSCWIRYSPVMNRQQFDQWYQSEPDPLNSFLVNAICTYTVKHMMIHHPCAAASELPIAHAQIKEMEGYFFDRAKAALEQDFDHSDRYCVIGLLLLAFRAEDKKASVYTSMATRALHDLEISPRMLSQKNDISFNDEDYEKEMDTRLWWLAWITDFAVYSGGDFTKNTPQTRYRGEIDLPRVFPQDKDEAEHAVLMYHHGIKVWRLQSNIINSLYESSDDDALTTEQLDSFEHSLQELRQSLPDKFRLDTKFQFTTPSDFIGCLRIQIELCATHIILHKLFLPDAHNIEQMSTNSLVSLNRCLYSAIQQLKMLKTTLELPKGGCSFDRDELWRSAEIISLAMTIHKQCRPDQSQLIMEGIDMAEVQGGLPLAIQIIRNTPEEQLKANLNFSQLKDWIEAEITKHGLAIPEPVMFAQHGNPAPAVEESRQPPPTARKKSCTRHDSDYDFVSFTISPTPSKTISKSNISQQQKQIPSSRSKSHSKSASTIAVQFQNSFGPPPSPAVSSPSYTRAESKAQSFTQEQGFVNQVGWSSTYVKGQPRFRYFSPKSSDKLMFIDENPMA
ncbi:hypothetical protein INT43_001873 [Umbelopsis isabellina]|uniref:Transcription factor domain-containing protein n=1 Tax=Mortierella isabellina TaxID=91625 RepID=A0A8H7PRB1_MORIS|nr:hypothetical protein INT43_001873 [Umbelopsis isabellina]